jgi:hypothetical protein
MIYIKFERGSPEFSNTTARALALRTAVQQDQLRAKWLLCLLYYNSVTQDILFRMWNEFNYRLDVTRAAGGGHNEHL